MERIKLDPVKHTRFIKSAEYRTNQILKKLRTLGHCSNLNYYQFLPNELEIIFSSIRQKVLEVENKFVFPTKNKFKL